MRITAQPYDTETAKPTGPAVLLGDDSDRLPVSGLAITHQRSVQVTPLFRGKSPFLKGRQNAVYNIAFTVKREHETAAAANAFTIEHPDQVPADCLLTLTEDYVGGISTKVLLAHVDTVDIPQRTGVTTFPAYRITAIPKP